MGMPSSSNQARIKKQRVRIKRILFIKIKKARAKWI